MSLKTEFRFLTIMLAVLGLILTAIGFTQPEYYSNFAWTGPGLIALGLFFRIVVNRRMHKKKYGNHSAF